jgi:hypothetical protein
MIRVAVTLISMLLFLHTTSFAPVTDEMLRSPSPNDWLMFSRTYDAPSESS